MLKQINMHPRFESDGKIKRYLLKRNTHLPIRGVTLRGEHTISMRFERARACKQTNKTGAKDFLFLPYTNRLTMRRLWVVGIIRLVAIALHPPALGHGGKW